MDKLELLKNIVERLNNMINIQIGSNKFNLEISLLYDTNTLQHHVIIMHEDYLFDKFYSSVSPEQAIDGMINHIFVKFLVEKPGPILTNKEGAIDLFKLVENLKNG
jgi:hypothetical protein